jgi:four helix bundle protein
MAGMFTQLRVWQIAHELTLQIYKVTASFPITERYGLTTQLRRAATAVPTNIAEGNARGHRREYSQYCLIARGSIAEVEYLLRLSRDLGILRDNEYTTLIESYSEVGRMLQRLINKLTVSQGTLVRS